MRRLAATEREERVRIVLAVESGSRAWGFASPDSDFDVRFVYAHPADWYLAVDLEERRDVIEYPITDDIDLNAWDVRKACASSGSRILRSSSGFNHRSSTSVRWIERYGSAAPIEFKKPLHLIEGQDAMLRDIEFLLVKKREAPEMGLSEPKRRTPEGVRFSPCRSTLALQVIFHREHPLV